MKGKQRINRREFLVGASALGISVLAAAPKVFGAIEEPSPTTAPATSSEKSGQVPADAKVPKRKFGRTGVEVSILSLGGMFDIPNNQLMLKKALDWGVTYWDTADCYGNGNSEIGIGMFFEKMPEARKQVFLVTKSDRRDPAGMTELLNRSLERLKTDYIDLYFVHGVSKRDEINEETRKWAEKAKAEKKIRFFGFSTHSNMEDLLEYAATLGWIDGIMVKYDYRLMHKDRMKSVIEACAKAGIGLTAMKTQGGGPVRTDTEAELKLAGHFLQKGLTPAQAKLKAVWENPIISAICSQMPNLTILKENVAAALDGTKLADADYEALREYAVATASSYCAGCRHICEDQAGCPAPIADVLRYMMYGVSYGDFALARDKFSELPLDIREQLRKVDLSRAEALCPQRLPISRVVAEAFSRLA